MLSTGCPRKNATDLKNSNGKCLVHIIKRLFLLKSAIIGIIFDIFCNVLCLVEKLKSANFKIVPTSKPELLH